VEQKRDNRVTTVHAAERACHDAPLEPTANISPSVSPLDVSNPSQNVIRGEHPWIDLFAVIPPGLNAARINRYNAVDDFGLASWRNKNDDIAWPDGPPIVGDDMQTIPISQERVHTGSNIINIFLFHLFHLFNLFHLFHSTSHNAIHTLIKPIEPIKLLTTIPSPSLPKTAPLCSRGA
jgi:hypothetical protein